MTSAPSTAARERTFADRIVDVTEAENHPPDLHLHHCKAQEYERIIIMKKSIHPWIPAAFCAFISLIPLSAPLITLFTPFDLSDTWWRPAFFAFLPFCFFLAGMVVSQMQREIRDLRKQLEEVQRGR